jgi:DNA-binding NarL/FixJ family response regulator
VALPLGELEIAHLVKEGKRTKDIAQVLNLSDKTIEDYRKQLRTKLGIRKIDESI